MTHSEALEIREWLQRLPPFYLKETLRAFRALDASLTVTQGEGWLNRTSGANIPYDIYSVLTCDLVPDEKGVLRSRKEA